MRAINSITEPTTSFASRRRPFLLVTTAIVLVIVFTSRQTSAQGLGPAPPETLSAAHQPYRTTIMSGPGAGPPLQCYVGTQNYEARPHLDNVTLSTCHPGDNCCFMMSSYGITQYGCHSECPPQLRTFLCGPDPDSSLVDLYYCYCKDSADPNCQPSETPRLNGSGRARRAPLRLH